MTAKIAFITCLFGLVLWTGIVGAKSAQSTFEAYVHNNATAIETSAKLIAAN